MDDCEASDKPLKSGDYQLSGLTSDTKIIGAGAQFLHFKDRSVYILLVHFYKFNCWNAEVSHIYLKILMFLKCQISGFFFLNIINLCNLSKYDIKSLCSMCSAA